MSLKISSTWRRTSSVLREVKLRVKLGDQACCWTRFFRSSMFSLPVGMDCRPLSPGAKTARAAWQHAGAMRFPGLAQSARPLQLPRARRLWGAAVW